MRRIHPRRMCCCLALFVCVCQKPLSARRNDAIGDGKAEREERERGEHRKGSTAVLHTDIKCAALTCADLTSPHLRMWTVKWERDESAQVKAEAKAEQRRPPQPVGAAAAASAVSWPPLSEAAVSFAAIMDVYSSPTLAGAAEQAEVLFGVSAAVAREEFRRFLQLKVSEMDSDATKLCPTPLMDHMWQAVILETELYERLQEQIGMKLHRAPTAAA